MANVTVLGSGGFGLALALVSYRDGHDTTVWSYSTEEALEITTFRENRKLLAGVKIPEEIAVSCDISCVSNAQLVIIATPSSAVRETLRKAAPFFKKDMIVVCAAKGMEINTLKTMSQIMEEEIGGCASAVLSGPSHAEEVAREVPTTVVAASKDIAVAQQVQELLSSSDFRVYVNEDVLGVELGGALKNVIALAAGMLDGMKLGDNSKAALMTRGIREISRLGVAMGAKIDTFTGLSGIGDLIVTCTSLHSRNRRAGLLIGQGIGAKEAVERIGMTVEGYISARCAYELAKQYGIEMPIINQVYKVIYEDMSPKEAVANLMGRPQKREMEALWKYSAQ